MPKDDQTIRLDELVLQGAEFCARSMGQGEVWDSGLGHIVGRVVGASDVSKRPISLNAAKRRVGLTDENVETARAVFNLGRRFAAK